MTNTTIYKHADFPSNPKKNGVINVEFDVPRLPIAMRERIAELDKKLNKKLTPTTRQELSEDEAICLLLRRGADKSRHPAVREGIALYGR